MEATGGWIVVAPVIEPTRPSRQRMRGGPSRPPSHEASQVFPSDEGSTDGFSWASWSRPTTSSTARRWGTGQLPLEEVGVPLDLLLPNVPAKAGIKFSSANSVGGEPRWIELLSSRQGLGPAARSKGGSSSRSHTSSTQSLTGGACSSRTLPSKAASHSASHSRLDIEEQFSPSRPPKKLVPLAQEGWQQQPPPRRKDCIDGGDSLCGGDNLCGGDRIQDRGALRSREVRNGNVRRGKAALPSISAGGRPSRRGSMPASPPLSRVPQRRAPHTAPSKVQSKGLGEFDVQRSRQRVESGNVGEEDANQKASEDSDALLSITITAASISEDLDKFWSNYEARSKASPPDRAATVEAEVLAKEITEASLQRCNDLEVADRAVRDPDEDFREQDIEVRSLSQISAATKLVCDEMTKLQETGWAAGVLAAIPTVAEPAEELSKIMMMMIPPPIPERSTTSSAMTLQPPSTLPSRKATKDKGQPGQARRAESTKLKEGSHKMESRAHSKNFDGEGHNDQLHLIRPRLPHAPSEASLRDPDAEPLASSRLGSQAGCEATTLSFASESEDDDLEEDGLRNLDLLRVARSDTDLQLTPTDEIHLHAAFHRFRVPGEAEVNKSDLHGLLDFLGHNLLELETILEVADEVTQYQYLTYEEFLHFWKLFRLRERAEFRKLLEPFDEDNSGSISVKELRKVMQSLGVMVLSNKMIMETIQVADVDRSGQLSFDELGDFLAVYRRSEGFTKTEVKLLRNLFEESGLVLDRVHEPKMRPENLSKALVEMFGLQVRESAKEVQEELLGRRAFTWNHHHGARHHRDGHVENLRFSEFLILARRVREREFEKCQFDLTAARHLLGHAESGMERSKARQSFMICDTDNSGTVSRTELLQAISNLGYTLAHSELNEAFEEVVDADDPDRELDLVEFFDFVTVVRQREGFSKARLEEYRAVFEKFDDDGSREISTLELTHMFRHMGYKESLEDVRAMLREVDEDDSEALDFQEFLRLMRLLREKELKTISAIFHQYASLGVLPRQFIPNALQALDTETPRSLLSSKQLAFNFDSFVQVVDACRADRVEKQRKMAGFNEDIIVRLREAFDGYDLDGSGHIDMPELTRILAEFHWEPKSHADQIEVVRRLDMARKAVREAGVLEVSPEGSAEVMFWEFVQLVRMLHNEQDRLEEELLENLALANKFSQVEMDQFRQVFMHWAAVQGGERLDPFQDPRHVSKKHISTAIARRVVRSLGLSLNGGNRDSLDEKLEALDQDGQLDFGAFLHLMRWMVDTDFGGISSTVASGRAQRG